MLLSEVYSETKAPSILIVGGHHGDEKTGVEIVKPFAPMRSDQITVVPCVNVQGYKAGTRDSNGVDLNRSYMIPMEGPTPEPIPLMKQLVNRADLVIDVHSTFANMLPNACVIVNDNSEQYGNLFNVEMIQQEAPKGSLRNYCVHNGIPMVTYEAVEHDPINDKEIETGVDGILRILEECGLN